MGDVIEYVVGFLFCHSTVLLVRKARPTWQRGRMNGIGGKVEPGERPIDAMVREFQEETTLEVVDAQWTHFATLTGDDAGGRFRQGAIPKPFQVYFYTARLAYFPERNVETATMGSDEPVFWFDTVNLRSVKFLPNLQWLIPMALAAHDIAPDLPYLIQEKVG